MMRSKKKQTTPKKIRTEPVSSRVEKLFIVDKEALAGALTWAHRIVERRQTIPVLSTILLGTNGNDGLFFATTNNEQEITGKIPAQVMKESAFAVSAHKLYAIALRMPEKEITFSLVKDFVNRIKITSGDVEFVLPSLAGEAFPMMEKAKDDVSFDLSAEEFLSLIDTTFFAVSTDETCYNLNGVYLHETEDKLVAVATDGHRLARVLVPLPQGAKGMPAVIVPRQTLEKMIELVREKMKPVHVFVSSNQIRFTTDGIEMLSRVIDGTYPDYERAIPVNNHQVMQVNVRAFVNALDRVAIVSEKSRGVRLSFSKNTLSVEGDNGDEGRGRDQIPIQYNRDDFEIGFNYRYLLDILTQIKGKNVEMVFDSSVTPAILKDAENDAVLYVLMPMRV